MLNKIQKALFYLLVALTPLIMFPRTSELFEFNKMIFIYFIALASASVWFIRSIRDKQPLFIRSPLDIPLIIHILIMGISTLLSIDRQTSLWGYYGRFNGGFISLLAYVSLFYSFLYLLKEEGERGKGFVFRLLLTSLVSAAFVILWGLPGKMGADLSCLLFVGKFDNACWTSQFEPASRMFSTLGQPNWLGAYLAIQFSLALVFFFKSIVIDTKNKAQFFLSAGFLLLSFSAILFTRSRSALGAVSVALVLMVMWLLFQLKEVHLRKRLYITAVILVGIIASLILFKTGIQKVDFFTTPRLWFPKQSKVVAVTPKQAPEPYVSSEISESFDIRKIVWQGAITLGNQYPLFGTGPETFAYAYYFVRPVAHNITSEWDYLYNKAHNEYLNYFATTGYSGLGTYLLVITVVLFMGIRVLLKSRDNGSRFLAFSGLVAYITVLITNSVGFSTTTINVFFYLIPAFFVVFPPVKKHFSQHRPSPTDNALIGGICVLFLVGVSYLYNYWSADIQYAAAESFSRTNDYQTAVGLLDKTLKSHYEHVYEDKLSYALSNLAFLAYYQHDTQTADRLMKLSDFYNAKSLSASSQNVLYWKTNAKNQYVFYQITLKKEYIGKGIQALKTAETLSPTDPKLPYFLATYDSLLWDEEKDKAAKRNLETAALDQIKTSITLKPDYRDAYTLQAQLLKKFGKRANARAAYEELMRKFNVSSKELEKEMEGL